MSGPRITDAAVEAVREAFKSATDSDEEAISDESDLFRFILTAALPHIRRAVIEELAEKCEAQVEALLAKNGGGPIYGVGSDGLAYTQAVIAQGWLRAELEGSDRG